MHRIDGPAAAPGGFFTDGDPNVGTPATVVTEDWANAVQEEIVSVILGAGIALSKPSNAQLLAAIGALVAKAVPAGAVQAFAMVAVPTGWLACNGAAVSRAAYPALFAAIGATYGAGDGSTTFGLPDLRGEFVRGLDAGRGVDAGRSVGTAQAGMVESHSHDLRVFSRSIDGGDDEGDNTVAPGSGLTGGYIGSTGGAETRPRNVALAYCIKA